MAVTAAPLTCSLLAKSVLEPNASSLVEHEDKGALRTDSDGLCFHL
ncbi:hypothetical protein ACVIWU_005810 [Bradyrhizobium sp. USDA 4509]|nr:hypothetical protein [Bradyrhizobium elkanii]